MKKIFIYYVLIILCIAYMFFLKKYIMPSMIIVIQLILIYNFYKKHKL